MGHEGHRERLRNKAAVGATETHEKLELLLFSVLPRVNTNEIAHELLDRFGGVEGVFYASLESLQSVKGIGRNAAIQIRTIASIFRDLELSYCNTGKLFSSVSERERYVSALFACLSFETTYMLMFSQYGKFLGEMSIGYGTATQTPLSIRSAIYHAKKEDAKFVIFAHNHTDKLLAPSVADIAYAKLINSKFASLGIDVLEHYVVAHGHCLPYSNLTKEVEA